MQGRALPARGSAHAKAILIGEHAVVYGRPAIAFPVPALHIEATALRYDGPLTLHTPFHSSEVTPESTEIEPLEKHLAEIAVRTVLDFYRLPNHGMSVRVNGLIPPARGLGSSAALAGAIASAVTRFYEVDMSDSDRFDIVQTVERVAHGTPSGLDALTTASQHPIWFQHGKAEPLTVAESPRLLIADSGESGRTADAVQNVRSQFDSDEGAVVRQLDRLADLTHAAREDLESGTLTALGQRISEAHEILRGLGVSSAGLDSLVETALSAGALGAKLTGGGQGGCIVVLADDAENQARIEDKLRASGATAVWRIEQAKEIVA